MKLPCPIILGLVIAQGAWCGCHITTRQPQFSQLPEERPRAAPPQPGDFVIKGAKPGTSREDLVSAIQKSYGSTRVRTNVHPESWLKDDQELVDAILSGEVV